MTRVFELSTDIFPNCRPTSYFARVCTYGTPKALDTLTLPLVRRQGGLLSSEQPSLYPLNCPHGGAPDCDVTSTSVNTS